MTYSFKSKLAFSLDARQRFDKDILRGDIPGCIEVIKTDRETDKTGVDYIAKLRKGGQILIDAKAREKGASKWWRTEEPELCLEVWSVIPDGSQDGKVGWTLSESTPVDYILYTFDPSDTDRYYLMPFQLLRMALIRYYRYWAERYGVRRQYSTRWASEAMFIPASVVIDAINHRMQGKIA